MILITRNEEKSLILSQNLKNKGFKTIIYPLFKVIYKRVNIFHEIFFRFHKVQSILITSSNAIPYFLQLNFDKKIKIFAVGSETGDNLKELGYKNIKIGKNSASSLTKIIEKHTNKKELILYLCGQIITENLALGLRNKGYNTKKIISYKIKEQHHLSDSLVKKIKNNKIKSVTIYSKNTSSILHKLLFKYNLLESFKKIELLCLSDEIANFSKKIGFTKTKNIDELLK